MAGFARHLCAVLVAIVVVAAQVMPAWAGCHSQRHAATTIANALVIADAVKVDESSHASAGHHGMSHAIEAEADVSSTIVDQSQPSQTDFCLGNCGCACGLGGAFVLANVTAINAPHGIALTPEFTTGALSLGDRPDGPRRPPRLTA